MGTAKAVLVDELRRPKSKLLPLLFTTLPAGVADALRLRRFHVYRPFGADVRPGRATA